MTVETLGRAVSLYRQTALSRSAIALVVANLIPLVGVLFFGWSLLTILVLYWIENGIVGIWNVPKIIMAQGNVVGAVPDMPPVAARAATGPAGARTLGGKLNAVSRTGLAIFFAIHYGGFWVGHGFFVLFALPGFMGTRATTSAPCLEAPPGVFPPEAVPFECATNPMGEVLWGSVAIAAVALFISHGASFLFNYLGRAEFRATSPARQMGSVYGRVVVLHLTIIFGGMVVGFLGSPLGALLVLVILKTAFDLGLHLREHRAAGARLASAESTPIPTTSAPTAT